MSTTHFRATLVALLEDDLAQAAKHAANSMSAADYWATLAHHDGMAADRMEQLIGWYDEQHPESAS
jgi:hypothetical protein